MQNINEYNKYDNYYDVCERILRRACSWLELSLGGGCCLK